MKEKYYCRNCRGDRRHKSLFEEKISVHEPDYNYFEETSYHVIQCLGCDTISFLEIYGNSDMYHIEEETYGEHYTSSNIYPLYLPDAEELKNQHLLPEQIRHIYSDTIKAFTVEAYILTAGGLRAIIEAVCNHEGIVGARSNLDKKIDLLSENGKLTLNESKRLHSIRFIGNDALHEIVPPSREQLLLLLTIVNQLLSNLFINDKILPANVEVIIDTFDDFVAHLKKQIKKDMIGQNFKLKEILNKSTRQIKNKHLLQKFERELIEEIHIGKIDFLKLTTRNATNNTFEVLRNPFSFKLSSFK